MDWSRGEQFVLTPSRRANRVEPKAKQAVPQEIPQAPLRAALGREADAGANRWMVSPSQVAEAEGEERALAERPACLPFALLRIFPAGAGGGPEPIQFDTGAAPRSPVRYRLEFKARETYWRYFVAPRQAGFDPARCTVVDLDSNEPGGFAHAAGDAPGTVVFTAATPRPLRRIPSTNLALRLGTEPKGPFGPVVHRLPAPSGQCLVAPEARRGPKIYSDMYVFV
jgi:hypothetical protein